MHKASLNIPVQDFVWIYVFITLRWVWSPFPVVCGRIGKEEKTEQNHGLSAKEGEEVMGQADHGRYDESYCNEGWI